MLRDSCELTCKGPAQPALRASCALSTYGDLMLRGTVELCTAFLTPRRSFSSRDSTHSFPKNGAGLRRLFRQLTPTLQELSVAHCSDIFHARSFADVAMLKARLDST